LAITELREKSEGQNERRSFLGGRKGEKGRKNGMSAAVKLSQKLEALPPEEREKGKISVAEHSPCIFEVPKENRWSLSAQRGREIGEGSKADRQECRNRREIGRTEPFVVLKYALRGGVSGEWKRTGEGGVGVWSLLFRMGKNKSFLGDQKKNRVRWSKKKGLNGRSRAGRKKWQKQLDRTRATKETIACRVKEPWSTPLSGSGAERKHY